MEQFASLMTGRPLVGTQWAEKIEDALILLMGLMPPQVEDLQLVCPEELDIKFVYDSLDKSGYYRASMKTRELYIEYQGETRFPQRLSLEGIHFLIVSGVLSSDPFVMDKLILAEQCNMFEIVLENIVRSTQIDFRAI